MNALPKIALGAWAWGNDGTFGGDVKNISIGFGCSMGKVWIHSGGTKTSSGIWGKQDPFLEAMPDSESLRRRIERQNGLYMLEVGAQNGLGSRNYRLVVLGE